MPKSLKELAQESLDVQNACNASGVVHSFSRAMTDLWDHARAQGKGTDWVNEHPIVTLYIDKLASLNRTQYVDMSTILKAFDRVQDLADGKQEAA